jgi:signal transduction histidine kinase
VALAVERPAEPVVVDCDRRRLELALANLLDNGLKFTPTGGRVALGVEALDEGARLWVADDGPGIPAEEQARIFERFTRGGAAAGTEGVGLGLAIVRGVVRAHGGEVWVESEPGVGSRFCIELPAR